MLLQLFLNILERGLTAEFLHQASAAESQQPCLKSGVRFGGLPQQFNAVLFWKMLWLLGLSGENQPPTGAASAFMGCARWDLIPFLAQLHLHNAQPGQWNLEQEKARQKSDCSEWLTMCFISFLIPSCVFFICGFHSCRCPLCFPDTEDVERQDQEGTRQWAPGGLRVGLVACPIHALVSFFNLLEDDASLDPSGSSSTDALRWGFSGLPCPAII